jgi:hypothetical protein
VTTEAALEKAGHAPSEDATAKASRTKTWTPTDGRVSQYRMPRSDGHLSRLPGSRGPLSVR